jgi:hypothetical protein
MSKQIAVTVHVDWKTSFDTKEEADEFVENLAYVHAQRYATDVVEEQLMANGLYVGSRNVISVYRSDDV